MREMENKKFRTIASGNARRNTVAFPYEDREIWVLLLQLDVVCLEEVAEGRQRERA